MGIKHKGDLILDIFIDFSLGSLQLYGLVFLLGSFCVASLSDIRRMSAQVEFTEIWTVFIVVFFIIDIIQWMQSDRYNIFLEWILILIFIILSNSRIGVLFKVAKGDLLACVAVLMVLPFFSGLLFVFILKITDLLLRPMLRRAGRGNAYPFMPVVLVAVSLLFVLEWLLLSNISFTLTLPF